VNKLGTVIKEVRQQHKLNQKDLGKSLGVSQSYISLVENGKEAPTRMFLRLFCLLYSVDEKILHKGEEWNLGLVNNFCSSRAM